MNLSDNVVIALYAGLPGTLAAIGSLITILQHRETKDKIDETKNQLDATKNQVDKIQRNTDGINEHLIQVSGQLEYRKGTDGSRPGFPEEEKK